MDCKGINGAENIPLGIGFVLLITGVVLAVVQPTIAANGQKFPKVGGYAIATVGGVLLLVGLLGKCCDQIVEGEQILRDERALAAKLQAGEDAATGNGVASRKASDASTEVVEEKAVEEEAKGNDKLARSKAAAEERAQERRLRENASSTTSKKPLIVHAGNEVPAAPAEQKNFSGVLGKGSIGGNKLGNLILRANAGLGS